MKNIFDGNNPNMGFNGTQVSKTLVIVLIVLAVAALGALRSFAIIDSRERGIVKYAGKVSERILGPGVQVTVPFISEIQSIEVITKKLELEKVKIYTKDQQSALVTIALNYAIVPQNVIKLYNTLGSLSRPFLEDTLIFPILRSTITNELGQWTAEEVVTKKEQIALSILKGISSEMKAEDIISISNFEIIAIDLDDAYERATREKVIAEQRAQMSRNKTVQIQEEANQKIIQAKAEAESMKIRSEALSQNRGLVEYEAVQKWDGKMPQYMLGGSMPFIDITPADEKKRR